MIKKRISTDLFLRLAIQDADGNAADMSAASDMLLYCRNQMQQKGTQHDFTIKDNVVSIQYLSSENTMLGIYDISILWNETCADSETGTVRKAVDFLSAFEIVESTAKEENVEVTLSGILYTHGVKGDKGDQGYSAFDVWNNYNGGGKSTADYYDFLREPATSAAKKVDELVTNVNNVVIPAAQKAITDTIKVVTDETIPAAEKATESANNAADLANKRALLLTCDVDTEKCILEMEYSDTGVISIADGGNAIIDIDY